MSTIRVDKITPYQSGSVEIESLSITNLTIEGTLTASIQEGYVLVGGSGNVSTLVPTSSFGGGGGSTDISALNSFTSSYNTGSFIGSFTGDGSGLTGIPGVTPIQTGSFATTGSNSFVGNQVISGSLTISGSSTFRNIGPTILSGSVNISGSINSDGYQLGASSTENIPTLNDSFNLDLSGSASTFIKKTLVLNDGKVLIVGRFESVNGHPTNHIARLNSNGTVDTSFTAPTIGASFDPGNRYINNLALQSNGKIIIVGNFYTVGVTGRVGVARLNTNGTEDFTFDSSNGLIDVGLIRDVVIQSDDKIIVVGQMEGGIKRMNSDGSADSSLDVVIGFSDNSFYSVALLDSGSEQAILVGGDFQQWDTSSDYKYIVKLNPNGSLDTGFAGTNLQISTGDNLDRIQKIKVTDAYSPGDNGYIYIAGRFKDTRTGPNVRNAGFARLTTADEGNGVGAFDSGFRTYISGSDQNLSGVSVYVNDFDFYDSDKILLGGNFITFGIPGYATTSANRFAIVSQNTGNIISNWSTDGLASKYRLNTGSVDSVTLLPNDNVLVGGTFTSASFPSTAREGLTSFKLTGFGEVTNTADYSITANVNELLISSSNTYFSGDITASVISGSFVGDGSGLTGVGSSLPNGVVSGSTQVLGGSNILSSSVTNFTDYSQSVDTRISSIVTGTGFATTGSNTFVGNQIVTGSLTLSSSAAVELRVVGDSVLSGSLTVTGSITVPGSGSFVNFVANPNTMRSIRGNGAGLYNIVEQSDGNMTFTVSKIGTRDLTGAITSNISGSTINGSFSDNTTTTSGAGRGARLRGVISGGTVTSLQIETANSSFGYEEEGQPANRQGIGYKAGDTVTIDQSLNQVTGSLTITLRQQDIDTYFGVDERVSIDYKQYGILTTRNGIISSGSISVGAGVNTLGGINGNSIAAGTDVNVTSDYSIAVGQDLYNDNNTGYANATFGLHHSSSNYAQTIVGIASRLDDAGEGAFVVGNGTTPLIGGTLTRSNLLVAQGSKVQVTGSLDVTGSVTADEFQLGAPSTILENTAYWLYGTFNNAGGMSFGFSSGNAITNIDNVYINETSSDINGAAIVNSIPWINGLTIGDVITIQGIDSSPSNLTQTIVLSVNSITDFSGAWGIGVSVLNSPPLAAAVNGSLYSLTYTTPISGELYTISADTSKLLVSSSNTEFNGFVVLSQVSSSYNYADDTAAQAGGVPLGGLYHTSGSIKIRLV